MLRVSATLLVLLAASFQLAQSDDESISVSPATISIGNPQEVELTRPVIQFKGVVFHSQGVLASVTGQVDRYTAHGWVPLRAGDVLEDGARFQLEAGASASIRFSTGSVVELSQQQVIQGFQVRIVPPANGT